MNIYQLSISNNINKNTIKQIQKRAFRQSLKLYLNSEIYNSLINTIVNYQSNFRMSPKPKQIFFANNEELTLYEFFKEFRKALILYGIVILRKENKNAYEYISPLLLNMDNPFNLDEDGTILSVNTEIGKLSIDDLIIFQNNPITGVNIFLPEYYFCFDEIDKIEQFKSSVLVKRTMIANIALSLKMQTPSEGAYFGKTEEEINSINNYVQNAISGTQVRPGSVITNIPDTSIEVVQPINSDYDEHYIYKRICEIASAVNVPAFLITGDLKELNYAAARSALQDFVVYSNREIIRLTFWLMRKLDFTARVTLPPPTTISTAESVKYFEFMDTLSKDDRYNFSVDEIKEKLKLGGLL